jgi:hypothetical protein
MTKDRRGIVPSYTDNVRMKTLIRLFNDEQELVRLNKHRRTHWTQK